jgi:hypothetical protein
MSHHAISKSTLAESGVFDRGFKIGFIRDLRESL